MRISDWSSDVCSSDPRQREVVTAGPAQHGRRVGGAATQAGAGGDPLVDPHVSSAIHGAQRSGDEVAAVGGHVGAGAVPDRKRVVSGKSVSVRVDLGGRRIIKKTNNNISQSRHT